MGFPGSAGKESACNTGDRVGKIPWRTAWQPTPVFLPGESPWTEEPGGLQSIPSQRVGHDRMTKYDRNSGSGLGRKGANNRDGQLQGKPCLSVALRGQPEH